MKFFRKTRKKLLANRKIGKYLAYAVGEVLLVMIGILLALQVNTWSANSSKEKSRIASYQKIKLQLEEDILVLRGNKEYNQGYFEQYQYAISIIENQDRIKMDTLAQITMNLNKFSDFHKESSVYETLVNSGEIKLLKNDEIVKKIQRLEELYIYINILENTHHDAVMIFIPEIAQVIKVNQMEVKYPDQLYSFEFQNYFVLMLNLMQEKDQIYDRTLNEVNSIVALIEGELN